MVTRRLFLCSAVGLAAVGCWRAPPEALAPTPAERLLDRMSARLALMDDVARAKWNAKAPADDPAREAVLLRAVADAGRAHGLDPADTTAFFAAQIAAAKLVQRDRFREWAAAGRGPFADAPDLARDIRPRIDAVGRELLAALADYRAAPVPAADIRRLAESRLTAPGVTAAVRAAAVGPLVAGP